MQLQRLPSNQPPRLASRKAWVVVKAWAEAASAVAVAAVVVAAAEEEVVAVVVAWPGSAVSWACWRSMWEAAAGGEEEEAAAAEEEEEEVVVA